MLSAMDDDEVPPFDGAGEENFTGDWQPYIVARTAAVTPDGHSLLFSSRVSLTGYSNVIGAGSKALDELFLYEAGSGELRCVSCDPTGKPPVPNELGLGAFFPVDKSSRILGNTYQARVISADGSRVFFDSGEPLVPQDTNGWLDVYEWERDGAGSCRESDGCVYLLSSGSDPESSYLLDASVDGGDVFILTRAQMLESDRNDNMDLYDARVGGVQPPASPACSGTGCQGVPPAPPIFATPSSVTFAGVGNFPAPVKTIVKVKKKPKKSKRCGKGSVKRRGKCVKKRVVKSAKGAKRHV